MIKNKLVAIDGNSLMNRAFYALPPLMTKDGIYTNAVYGFINMLGRIKTEYDPEYLVIAFDRKAPTFRHIEYTEYKAGRKKTPMELLQQIPLLQEILKAMNIDTIELDGYEADDLIGTIVKKAERENINSVIITGDKDELQLISDMINVVITKKGISEFDLYDMETMRERYGMTPEQFIDLKGLMGDASDNIPGIPGVGEKTGLNLIHQFGSVENLIKNLEEVKNEKLRLKIEEHAQLALMSRRLAEINTSVPIEINIQEYRFDKPDKEQLIKLYQRLELYSLVVRLNKEFLAEKTDLPKTDLPQEEESQVSVINITEPEQITKKLKSALKEQETAVIKIFGDYNHIAAPAFYGMAVLVGSEYYFINDLKLLKEINAVLCDSKVRLQGHNLKDDYYTMIYYGCEDIETDFDTAIAQYVLDPQRSNYNLKALVMEYFGQEIDDIEALSKASIQTSLFESPDTKFSEYGLIWCRAVARLQAVQKEAIKREGLAEVYFDIELPLIEIFASMENQGFRVDKNELMRIGKDITKRVKEISDQIYELAGEQFNINSPKQMGPILFDKLGLMGGKKTKTGFSTSADILDKLVDAHPIVSLILEYRTLTKLNGTYIDGLIPLININDGKIHAHFQQTVTATGRISCTEPNLQNIPIKQELGRTLRKAFTADNEESILVGSDYSQIELRILAHLSNDEALKDAFYRGLDIHTATAARVFDIPEDAVTPIQRGRAKAVNFGVIYGMSGFGLSENLNIPIKEAEGYIKEYFKKYQSVKEYMDGVIASCAEKGYVTTIKNRKRMIPEIRSTNRIVRQMGERLAMNSPIQGSAADIMKIAMISVYKELRDRKFKSRIILQVHDELIINTYLDELEEIKELLKRNMIDAIKLSVPVTVSMDEGKNWYEVK